jgi:putative membrane protein
MVKPFTPESLGRVKEAIEEAEGTTAGEIRVVVAEHSGPSYLLAAGVAAALAAAAVILTEKSAWGFPNPAEVAGAIAIAFGVGLGGDWLVRRLAANALVHRNARREFVRLGIGRTSGHTGVLLLISVKERRAVLLADTAIHQKVAEGTWDGIIQRLVAHLGEGRPEQGLVGAVKEIGQTLAAHFPPIQGQRNELPDDVVIR